MDSSVQVGDQFIASDDQDDVLRTEMDRADPIAYGVKIDKLALFGERIGAGEKKIRQKTLPAPLVGFFRFDAGLVGIDNGEIGIVNKSFVIPVALTVIEPP